MPESNTSRARWSKTRWRTWVLEGRASTSADIRSATDSQLVKHLCTALASQPRSGQARRSVCAYVPVGREPGGTELLPTLAARGFEILLPISQSDYSLEWAPYDGAADLQRSRLGMLEPTTARRGVDAIATAQVIVVPALAVDQSGTRLGRGAGYYDRALARRSRASTVIALVNSREFVEALPSDAYDVRVSAVVTPDGFVALPMPGK